MPCEIFDCPVKSSIALRNPLYLRVGVSQTPTPSSNKIFATVLVGCPDFEDPIVGFKPRDKTEILSHCPTCLALSCKTIGPSDWEQWSLYPLWNFLIPYNIGRPDPPSLGFLGMVCQMTIFKDEAMPTTICNASTKPYTDILCEM